MISLVQVRGLRGLTADLPKLTRLAVLIGPNGSGKSTILDAIHIGADRRPAASLGWAVQRRGTLTRGARWLLPKGDVAADARIAVAFADDSGVERTRQTRITSIVTDAAPEEWAKKLRDGGILPAWSFMRVWCDSTVDNRDQSSVVGFGEGNRFTVVEWPTGDAEGPVCRLVDPLRFSRRLDALYSDVREKGELEPVNDLLRTVAPEMERIEILTDDGIPRVSVSYKDRSIPLDVSGDGLQLLVRTALELGSMPNDGVILLEEPETHQHPATIAQMAAVIGRAVERGLQVIATTHSLDFIDALLDMCELRPSLLEHLSVHRVGRVKDVLRVSRFEGALVREARHSLGEDLR